jgi:hypothetical protein
MGNVMRDTWFVLRITCYVASTIHITFHVGHTVWGCNLGEL